MSRWIIHIQSRSVSKPALYILVHAVEQAHSSFNSHLSPYIVLTSYFKHRTFWDIYITLWVWCRIFLSKRPCHILFDSICFILTDTIIIFYISTKFDLDLSLTQPCYLLIWYNYWNMSLQWHWLILAVQDVHERW